MQEIHVTENEAGQRLDKLLAKFLREAPKSFLYKMLRKKNITLNGKKAGGQEKLQSGDCIKLFLSDETIEKFSGTSQKVDVPKMTLDIVYEDQNVLFLNKPVGMLSQKAKDTDYSAVEYVIAYLLREGEIEETELRTFRPSVCNRLDRNTSGLLAAGKSLAGLQELSRLFKERSLAKYYLCPVKGKVDKDAKIKGYLFKNEKTNKVTVLNHEIPGSVKIETEYHPLFADESMTLLEVHLITGKTHQIRSHLSSVGHPILGDYKYGDNQWNSFYKKKYGLSHQLLHAYRLEFPMLDGPLSNLSHKIFYAPIPELFCKICRDAKIIPERWGEFCNSTEDKQKGEERWLHGIQEV